MVGGESTCLECLEHGELFEKYYGIKSVPVDSVFRYMLMFLKRTLCYVKENDLYILLGMCRYRLIRYLRLIDLLCVVNLTIYTGMLTVPAL